MSRIAADAGRPGRRARIAGAMALVALAPVHALELPRASSYDERIQTVAYNADDVVLVLGQPRTSTHVILEEGERIVNASPGLGAAWSITLNEQAPNHLWVWPRAMASSDGGQIQPRAGDWYGSLSITTDRRVYQIELGIADLEVPGREIPTQLLRYTYPDKEADRAAADADEATRSERLAELDAAPPVFRNGQYTYRAGEHSEDIVPQSTFDDGRFTYFGFPRNTPLPAVFVLEVDGGEAMINPDINPNRPDEIRVDRIARTFVLRSGQAVVAVYNKAFDPTGRPVENGTTVPGLVRRTREGSQR